MLDVATKDAQRLTVEGAHVHAARHPANQLDNALAHLVGRLVGEGHGQNVPGSDAGCDEIGHAAGDDTRLAGPGAGEHQQRTVDVVDGGTLLVVQTTEVRGRQTGGLRGVGCAHGRF